MENVAVVGCTVTLSPGEGVAQITTDASLKVKADGKALRASPVLTLGNDSADGTKR